MAHQRDIVTSSLTAVLPGAALRGTVLGVILAGFTYLYLFTLWESTRTVLAPLSPFRLLVTVAVLPATVLIVFGLATAEYTRRRYELKDEEIVENRGVLRTKSNSIPYSEITDVHLLQSTLQRLFGVGTIRINNQGPDTTDSTEAMRLRFVTNPRQVYERLRADSGRSNAVPRVSITPDPVTAAKTSATRGLIVGPVFGFVPVVLLGAALQGQGVSTGQGLLVGVGVIALLICARAIHIYQLYDQREYEVYDDRVEDVGGSSTTAVSFEDVDDIRVYKSLGRLAFAEDGTSLLESSAETTQDADRAVTKTNGSRNRIDLLDADEEVLLSIRYIAAVDRLRPHLTGGLTAARSDEQSA